MAAWRDQSTPRDVITPVNLLLDHGANVDVRDTNGNTPLLLAACTSRLDIMTCLLNAGITYLVKNLII
jgi:ankyrin repeat protein